MAACQGSTPGPPSGPDGALVGERRRTPTSASLPTALRFSHLALEDGLPQLDVHAILQDSLGFVWIGTEGGLVRYDGQRARVFRPQPFDTTSLSNPWVVGLEGAEGGDLWVLTEGAGLSRYDTDAEAFEPVPTTDREAGTATGLEEWVLARALDGALWIGHRFDGLTRYDPDTRSRRTYPVGGPDGLSSGRITALEGTRDGQMWVGTEDGGLHRIDTAGRISRIPGPGGREAFGDGAVVRAVLEDREGRLWVGTDGRGLWTVDPATGAATRVRGAGAGLGSDAVWSLLEDPTGVLWVGLGDGLAWLEPATTRLATFRHDPTDPTSLGAGGVQSLFLDRSGVFWVGTQSGVSRFAWQSPRFERVGSGIGAAPSLSGPGVWSFLEDRQGVLWVGTTAGLDRIDPETGAIRHYAHDPADAETLLPGWVVSIYEDDAGRLWVGSRRGGLNLLDRATGRVTRFTPDATDPTALPTDNPWRIVESRAGELWVLTNGVGCLSRLDPDAGTFAPLCPSGDPPTAKSLVEREDGIFWVGTWDAGLWRLDTRTGEIRQWRHDPTDRQTPSSNYVMSLHLAADGDLWLGTYGAGLSRFDPDTERFTHYTTATSDLPDDIIYDILSDDAGHVWLSSNRGLTRFDPDTETFWTFGMEDGLQDLEFNAGTAYRAPDGTFYFGGINGFNRFDPTAITPDPAAPRAVVMELVADGEPVAVGGGLDGAPPVARALRMAPGQQDLAIDVAALHYVAPDRNRFRFRLDGYDAAWSPPTSEGHATYTNLDPGAYTFRVAAANPDGVWGPEATLTVTVVPPWWRSAWAYGLYALLALGAVGALYRARRNQLQMQHRMELEHIEAEQLRALDRSKSRFFANVSHEFRTPLTLTLGPLDDVLAGEYGPVPGEASSPLRLARRSAGRVLALINQILDLSRLEAGSTSLRARRLEVAAFVEAQVETFRPLASHRRITVDVSVPDEPLTAWVDPEHAGTILANLLSNAFKFTPAGGAVHVSVEADAERVRVSVRDTGSGIAPADLPHIFDRFFQAEGGAGQPLGSGIGLALAHELAALHGGALTAESVGGGPDGAPSGSTFTLVLPLGRAHLAPGQVDDRPWDGAAGVALALDVPLADPVDPVGGAPDEDVTTVLVADDQADIRAYVRRHLVGAGYRVVEAADGQDALDRIRQRLPDLVVSDVMMPRLDGLGLCRALRADPETDFVPVLLLTAKAAPEDRLDGLAELCDDYLTKPFDVRELVVRVGNLIALRHRLRERFAASSGDGAAAEGSPTPAIESADEAFAASVRAAIDAHLGDESFNVGALAEAVGLSRSHLLRRTTALLGAAPSDLIRTARLDRAAALLAARAGTVSEVTYGVGFKSVAHFSDAFLAHTGSRPSVYAEASRC
ncbi:two-component regulator propeller domain-containing protein [Rubrivirga sp. IMCC43871]|uniref:two-component regulator propeller domain-containing protein n=1 Tax=Rubrivirga sp. IMCC43871 TaxID=3391575 RepID=UPI003990044E